MDIAELISFGMVGDSDIFFINLYTNSVMNAPLPRLVFKLLSQGPPSIGSRLFKPTFPISEFV